MFYIPVGGFFSVVDEDFYVEYGEKFWCLDSAGYPIRNTGHSGLVRMHSHILEVPRGMCVDHINRNKLDNRKDNLRICTHAQNSLNRPPNRGKYKGVFKHSQYNKYCAQFQNTHLGVYDSEIEAAKAYDDACLNHEDFEYCYLNFGHTEVPEFTPAGSDFISKPKKGKSQYVGVTKQGNGWTATKTINGKRRYIGYFDCEHKAAKAIEREIAKSNTDFTD